MSNSHTMSRLPADVSWSLKSGKFFDIQIMPTMLHISGHDENSPDLPFHRTKI